MGALWDLNLDAELELAGHTMAKSGVAAMQRVAHQIDRSALPFIGARDFVLGEGKAPEHLTGRAWCPTPKAIDRLQRAGAKVAPAPSAAVLRRVNHRKFCADLSKTFDQFEGAQYVEYEDQVAQRVSSGGEWLLKRPLSMAGRGKRPVRGTLTNKDRRWIAASLRRYGGLQVEPRVIITAEFSLHGFVTRCGAVDTGEPLRQHVLRSGTWSATEPAGDTLTRSERDQLTCAAEVAGQALAEARYWGPFGIDAFRYLRENEELFRPLSEINARFTMAWGLAGPNVSL